jgi:transcriptional coactivator HFI1/ADA1
LSLRLSQLAKAYDLTLAPESTSEIGEFMAVGMDSHVADVMTTLVRLIGQDRRGVDTIHIPTGLSNNEKEEVDDKSPVGQVKEEHDLPKPDLDTMQYLFNLVPELHTQASPAVYKLLTSQAKPNVEVQHIKTEAQVHSPLATTSITATARPGGSAAHISPVKSTLGLPGVSKVEATKERLIKSELLKLDSGKGDGEGKKDRKHLNHWKYEDPAVAFQDLLG